MDATVNLQLVLLLLSLLLGVVNFLAVISLRAALDGQRNRIDTLDRRVVVVEERISGIGEIKMRVITISDAVAALTERSAATQAMVYSIQEFLREQTNERG